MSLAFTSIITNDPVESADVGLIQDQLEGNFRVLNNVPFLDGRWLTGVTLASGDNNISHGLGRAYQGVLVTRITAAANLYVNETNILKDRIIIINSSAIAEADFWIF